MDAIIEGLLYVQGDIGLTIKDIMNINMYLELLVFLDLNLLI